MTHATRLGSLALCVTVAGCAPVLPFHFAETAETLARNQISVQIAGGGGATPGFDKCCGGLGMRVRAGLGRKMELGVETAVQWGASLRPGLVGLQIAYKLGLKPWIALLLRSGVTASPAANPYAYFSTDAALVASSPRLAERYTIYGGVRTGVSTRVDEYPLASTLGLGGGLTIPLGLEIAFSERVRLFLEGGFVGSWNRLVDEDDPRRPYTGTYSLYGGYGALAFGYVFR